MVIILADMCYKYADYIIRHYNQSFKLNNKRLQKILFVANVIYSRKNKGERLFEDTFEAWDHGPVMPEVYKAYSIFQLGKMYPLLPEAKILSKKIEAIEEALEVTKNIETNQLIDNTHKENTPWTLHYNNEKPSLISDCGFNQISQESIYEFYRKKENYEQLISASNS